MKTEKTPEEKTAFKAKMAKAKADKRARLASSGGLVIQKPPKKAKPAAPKKPDEPAAPAAPKKSDEDGWLM